jgi:hypothetical protein
MVTFRFASALVGLLLIGACGSPSSTHSVAASLPSSNPAPAGSPASSSSSIPTPAASPSGIPTPAATPLNPVLIGYSDSPPTVIVMRLNGSVVATLPGDLVAQHAVGAYLVVASNGSGREWTVDASGVIRNVAPAAAKLMTPVAAANPLILDSSTALIGCGAGSNACTAEEVNLTTGAVRPLLTVPATTGQAAMALGASLTILDVSSDRRTVWLRKVNSASLTTAQLEIVGIDLQTGGLTSQALPKSLVNEHDLAISRDGKSVAGQEEFGTDSSNLVIQHLHVVSLGTTVDSDLEGTAAYVQGWPPPGPPTIMFAPDQTAVAWWGGLNNGETAFRINVAVLRGTGRTLWRLDNTNFSHQMSAVYWVDPTTLVVQTATSTTPGNFNASNLQTFTINTTTGAQKALSTKLHSLIAVLN